MANPFDQFDAPQTGGNVFDQFDAPPQGRPSFARALIGTADAGRVKEVPAPSASQALLEGELEGQFLARQRVSPHVFAGNGPKPQRLGDLEIWDTGPAYKDASGQLRAINTETDFVAIDPETGKRSVFARNPKDSATNEGAVTSFARTIVPGLATGPVAGIQRAAAVTTAPRPVTTGAALATERAREAIRDSQAFQSTGVREFGPAFNQGPSASVARQLTETPLVGAPLKNALDESLRDTAGAVQSVANRYGSAATAETAGSNVRTGIERFRDARPAEIVERSVEGYSPEQLSQIIGAPARDTSLKTKQAALYQRAWDLIPAEMQQGRSVEGLPRVLGAMPETRALLEEIQGRNLRMINASAPGAEAAAKPVASGGMVGRMVEAMLSTRWRSALQSMRDIRSDFRRMASGIGDTEQNTMRLSDLDRMQSTITKDMIGLLERNVADYQKLGRTQEAANIQRAIKEFRRADVFTRASMVRMEAIEKLFDAPTSEALYRNVASAALAGGRGDIQKLRVLAKTLRGEEMDDLASAVIREMGKPIASARGVTQEIGFSPSSFVTRFNNMTPEARHIFFGGEHAKAMEDLFRVANRLANVEALTNTSRSGTNALNMSGLVSTIGLGATGNWPAALAVGSGGFGLSLLLSRPAYTRWAVGYAQLRAAALRAPLNQSGGQLAAHIQRLGQLAAKDPQLIPVYRAIAEENGIKQRGDEQQP